MSAGTPAPLLPNDRHGEPIQTLSPEDTSVVQVSLSASNARVALPAGSQVVEIGAQDTCRAAFGDLNVDATSGTRRLLTAGVFVYKVPVINGVTATHIAFVNVSGSSGIVTVTKLV